MFSVQVITPTNACITLSGSDMSTTEIRSSGYREFHGELVFINLSDIDISVSNVSAPSYTYNKNLNAFTHYTKNGETLTLKKSNEFLSWNARMHSRFELVSSIVDLDPTKQIVFLIDSPPVLQVDSARRYLKEQLSNNLSKLDATLTLCLMDETIEYIVYDDNGDCLIGKSSSLGPITPAVLFDLTMHNLSRIFTTGVYPMGHHLFSAYISTQLGSIQSSASRQRAMVSHAYALPFGFSVFNPDLLVHSMNISGITLGRTHGMIEFDTSDANDWSVTLIGSVTESVSWNDDIKFELMARDRERIQWLDYILRSDKVALADNLESKTYFFYANQLTLMEPCVASMFRQSPNTKLLWNKCKAASHLAWAPKSYAHESIASICPVRYHSVAVDTLHPTLLS